LGSRPCQIACARAGFVNHVSQSAASVKTPDPFNISTHFWGWSDLLAWSLSCVLWGLTLSRHELMTAQAISSLRYALTGVAAWAFLSEGVGWQRGAGMLLIGIGILLVK